MYFIAGCIDLCKNRSRQFLQSPSSAWRLVDEASLDFKWYLHAVECPMVTCYVAPMPMEQLRGDLTVKHSVTWMTQPDLH